MKETNYELAESKKGEVRNRSKMHGVFSALGVIVSGGMVVACLFWARVILINLPTMFKELWLEQLSTYIEASEEISEHIDDSTRAIDSVDDNISGIAKLELSADEEPERIPCEVFLTDMSGEVLLGKISGNTDRTSRWILEKNQDVLVRMDLPVEPNDFNIEITSTYPYQVKSGENGVIEIEVTDVNTGVIYVGSLLFTAYDDLTMQAGVQHCANYNSGEVVAEDNYIHYSLYTSTGDAPRRTYGGYSGWMGSVHYWIEAIGDFDESEYNSDHCAYCGHDIERQVCRHCSNDWSRSNPEWVKSPER